MIQSKPAPLILKPVIEGPFDQIALDIAGPFLKYSARYQYILVIIDYGTRFPEVVPLYFIPSLLFSADFSLVMILLPYFN